MNTRRAIAAAIIALSVAGCGGGSSVAPQPGAKPLLDNTLGTARGTASVLIPAGRASTSATRGPRWVSPSTQSISISVTRESDHLGTYFKAVTTPSAPNCTPVTGGTLCQIPFGAPPGVDDLVIYAYDGPDPGASAPLASYARNGVSFNAMADNSMSFTLGGILGSIPPLNPAPFSAGTASDYTVQLNLRDIDGNPITGLLDAPLCVVIAAGGTSHFTITSPAAGSAGTSSVPCVIPPRQGGSGPVPPATAGIGIVDASKVPSVTVHYDGQGTSTAQLAIGSQSIDTARLTNGAYFTTATATTAFPDYQFLGATATRSFSASGGTIAAGPYQGVTLSSIWGSNGNTTTTFTASIAKGGSGSADVTPASPAFPFYTGSVHVVTYMKFTGTPQAHFAQTPDLTVTVASPSTFGGASCALYGASANGGVISWSPQIGPATPSSATTGTVHFSAQSLPPPNTVAIGNATDGNPAYLFLGCQ